MVCGGRGYTAEGSDQGRGIECGGRGTRKTERRQGMEIEWGGEVYTDEVGGRVGGKCRGRRM